MMVHLTQQDYGNFNLAFPSQGNDNNESGIFKNPWGNQGCSFNPFMKYMNLEHIHLQSKGGLNGSSKARGCSARSPAQSNGASCVIVHCNHHDDT